LTTPVWRWNLRRDLFKWMQQAQGADMHKPKRQVKTKVLTGFGAALAAVAGNLAMAAESTTIQKAQLTQPALSTVTTKARLNASGRCNLHDESCLMNKPYVKTLNDAQRRDLKVLIGLGVQTDIKDACLVC
jgi:hypothetical protein